MRIFISYANEDEAMALRLYRDLRQNGHEPWIACRDILPGQDWEAEIRRAIEGCRFFIAVLSTTSVGKTGYVQREVRMASDIIDRMPPERIFVIPVRLDDCDIPYERIRGRQWQNLFPSYEKAVLDRILSSEAPNDLRRRSIRDLVMEIGTSPQVSAEDRAVMIHTVVERGRTVPGLDNDFLVAMSESSIRIHPTARAYFNPGLLEGYRGRQRESLESYTKAIEHGDPNPSLCYLNIGNRYRALGENDRALSSYEQSITLNPKQANAWFGAAQLYSNAGEVDQAMRCYRAYIDWFDSIPSDRVSEQYKTQASIARAYMEQYGQGGRPSQQADLLAVRVLASCVLFQAQGMRPSGQDLSWDDAVHNFEEAVKAWDIAKTPTAAIAAVATAL